MRRILKYALIIIRNNKLLLQRETDQEKLLLPGGKPEQGEDYLQCLKREIKEELGTEIKPTSLSYLGAFEDMAADGSAILTVQLYEGELKTQPKPCNEVKEIVWFSLADDAAVLSPVIRNKILPYLLAVHKLAKLA